MTKGQKNKLHLSEALEARYDLEADRWGHYQFTVDGKRYRLKFQKQSIRLESHGGTIGWRRITSVPAGRVHVTDFAVWLNLI